jgi:hypothetical protein
MAPVWDFAIAYFKKLYMLSYFSEQFIKTTSTPLVELLVEPKQKKERKKDLLQAELC